MPRWTAELEVATTATCQSSSYFENIQKVRDIYRSEVAIEEEEEEVAAEEGEEGVGADEPEVIGKPQDEDGDSAEGEGSGE